MTEENKLAPEVEKSLTEATSSGEIADILAAQPRDDKGRFVPKGEVAKIETTAAVTTEVKKDDEPVVYKDSFLIGGKEMEFTGESPADIQKQVKVALQADANARVKVEEKKEPVKTGPTAEELAALQLKAATDPAAMGEYIVKSGTLDRYLESKGIKIDQIKEVLDQNASRDITDKWGGAIKDFLEHSDWPGGKQNEYMLKTKLAELKDDGGQPLAYSPSEAHLMRAYEALKTDGLLLPKEEAAVTTEEKKESITTTTTPPKKAATSSTLLGTTGGNSTRKTTPTTPKVPEITPEMTGQEIMEQWKAGILALGQSPNEAFLSTYSGKS
jgi:hypothetical protein